MAPIIIDTEIKLKILLTHIQKRIAKARADGDDVLGFIDLEGINLSRQGRLAIIQLLIAPEPVVLLIDVHVIGVQTFEITQSGTSFRSLLEGRDMFKVFFDVRNDSDALFSLFNVTLDGIIDLQLLEYFTRPYPTKYLTGLAKCIERDLGDRSTSAAKEAGVKLFAPEKGGKYEVFLERPMLPAIVSYCELDVMLMPKLLLFYARRVSNIDADLIQKAIVERIAESQSADYIGHGAHKRFGPSMPQVVSL